MTTLVENYHTFRPKADFAGSVGELLSGVPLEYLVDLDRVMLTDSADLSRSERHRCKANKRWRLGAYSPAYKGRPPVIRLYVDKITAAWPVPLLRSRFIREAILGQVLFHEIGHHIQASLLSSQNTEEMADLWMERLRRQYVAVRHPRLARLRSYLAWFLLPVKALLGWLLRMAESRRNSDHDNSQSASIGPGRRPPPP